MQYLGSEGALKSISHGTVLLVESDILKVQEHATNTPPLA